MLAVVALEPLSYQGRYIVNDLIGRVDDAAHPSSVGRGRTPTTLAHHPRCV